MLHMRPNTRLAHSVYMRQHERSAQPGRLLKPYPPCLDSNRSWARVRLKGAGVRRRGRARTRASLQLVEHGLVQRAQVRGPLVNCAVLVHVQRAVVQLQQLVHLQCS